MGEERDELDKALDADYVEADQVPTLGWWEKTCHWIYCHKWVAIGTVIGIPVLLFIIGAKCFGKTVVSEPVDSNLDHYQAIPSKTISTTEYEWELKPEYRN